MNMKRREFVSMVSAAMGVSLISACRKNIFGTETASQFDMMAARGGAVVTRYPLKFPSEVSPSNLSLSAAPGTSDLSNGAGQNSNVWQYNGSFPGPTIRANKGETVSIQLQNHLPEETITHWHGMIVNHENDGHPMDAFAPGGVLNYNYTINQRAALNWYHPHPHMLTGKQVYLGQAGAFIINDAEELALGLPSGVYEVPLIIRDATLDNKNNLSYKPSAGGMFGKIPLVNGTRNPYLSVERAVYRFRILNGSNSRVFGLVLNNPEATMTLIGNDGGLLPSAVTVTRIEMANGERTDVLIDFTSIPNGTNIMLRDLRAGWDLLEFRVSSTSGGSPINLSSPLSTIIPLTDPVTTREFSFDAMSKINGKEYDMNRIDWTVPFGVTERWRFKANGNGPHPVHVHGASFQVVSRTGGRNQTFPWEAGWKDTVLLEDSETVDVFIKFDSDTGGVPNKGIYLLHCHKLEHEDMGMMANFEVV